MAAGCAAKRTAIDCLGFLLWWTTSISRWDVELDHQVVTYLKDIQLQRFRKRGVMVDLEWDWRHLNISNLICHRVPVAYPWDSSLAASPRFTALSPMVLRIYNNHRQLAREDVHSSALHRLDNEISLMLKFDDFFQELTSKGRPDPSIEFDEDWEY